ncbi:MAG: hypothetical protein HY675_17975, partial [Chloroflexi bacterium]|nr:hypothetical protein [Chloroflexota bacterium]
MSRAAKYYIGMVVLGGLVSLAYGAMRLPQPDKIWVLALLVVLCGLAQAAPVPLFSNSSVSVAFAMSFISLLLFGPAGAILANLGSAAVHALYPKRRPWYKIIFNTGVFTISAALAGATYVELQGPWPVRDLTSAAIPLGAAALVYFLVNTGMISLVVSLTTGADFRKVFNEN